MAKKKAAKASQRQSDTKQDIADCLSLSAAAKLAGCSARTIRRKIDQGLLRSTRQGRSVFVSESEVRTLDKPTRHAPDTPDPNVHIESVMSTLNQWLVVERQEHNLTRKLLTDGKDELALLGSRVAAAEASQRGAWILAAALGVAVIALAAALVYLPTP